MEAIIAVVVIAVVIIVALPTIIFTRRRLTPEEIGEKGENFVSSIIGESEPNEKYVIHNLLIVNNEKTSQIDHVVITRVGIFVIETKNHSGRIYGNEQQLEWTQVLAHGRVKNKFYNPIKQNRSQIFHLSKIVGKKDCFIPIIIFPQAQLMTELPHYVGNGRNFQRIYNETTKIIFSVDEINEIYTKLLEIKNNPQATKEEHIQNINKMQENVISNICPRCSRKLILRNGRNGSFYGCTGYPSCRFTKNQKAG